MHTPPPGTLAKRTDTTYPGTTSQVRADLRGLLDGCPMADDVILCASELAANAALHSNSRQPGGQFTIRAEIHPGDYAWIEVEDNGGPWPHTPSPGRGHGLDIVAALASDWGIDGDDRTRTVWTRFDWPDDTRRAGNRQEGCRGPDRCPVPAVRRDGMSWVG